MCNGSVVRALDHREADTSSARGEHVAEVCSVLLQTKVRGSVNEEERRKLRAVKSSRGTARVAIAMNITATAATVIAIAAFVIIISNGIVSSG